MSNSAYFVGWGVGGIPLGLLADRYGRKIIFVVMLLVFGLAAAGLGFVTTVWQFIALRFIIGIAYSGSNINAYILVTELMPKKDNTKAQVMFLSGSSITAFLLVLMSYFERRWKWQLVYSAIPSLCAISFCL